MSSGHIRGHHRGNHGGRGICGLQVQAEVCMLLGSGNSSMHS